MNVKRLNTVYKRDLEIFKRLVAASGFDGVLLQVQLNLAFAVGERVKGQFAKDPLPHDAPWEHVCECLRVGARLRVRTCVRACVHM